MRADCHCHTLHSDGALSVAALLNLAKEAQLSGLSITDHDTLAAYPEALPLAETLGIQLVSGIEISAQHQNTTIHVLGYAFDLNNKVLNTFCAAQKKDRHARNQKILDKLAAIKMPIAMEELTSRFPIGTPGRPHIAHLMVEKGYVKDPKDAFLRYLGEKKRCFVQGFEVTVEDAIDIIHQAGGFAVLAHPHYVMPKRIVPSLVALPFDGLEVFYGTLTADQERPWFNLAQEKGWLMTGGSDFHGGKKKYQKLGCSYSPPETFATFVERFSQYPT